MNEESIESVEQLIGIIQRYAEKSVVYRGIKSSRYELLPKIGRRRKNGQVLTTENERYILKLFKQRAIAHLQREPKDDWEWLFVAQHHGLPTRLMDWTRNALVAAYFAVAEEGAEDCALYAYRNGILLSTEKHPDPFEVPWVSRVLPSHLASRITAQSGLFTIHPDPSTPFNDPEIDKFVIPAGQRRAIKKSLDKVGINAASIFPDLDGIARHIDWGRTDEY
jgi:hypothetical protein